MNVGSRLSSYEITGALGAGGMGEVYRARDTKLGRDVALKVLPEALARDAERMARMRREAQVLASLNHPNMAAIYGFEDSGATHALVMELVEGPTLAERISGVRGASTKSATEGVERKSGTGQNRQSGAIPVEEALPIAKQIAEGLEYAHERGIVHRDLKPANIKLASDDTVKILDFGLAKALEGDPASMDISTSPTISRMATQAGIILGTAAYMSPEQAKGKSVDRRTDIWAFGCVLYEMLAGKKPFDGETITDVLAAVIMKEPDWSRLPANTPTRIRKLLQRCLKKDPRQRLQSIGDARIALEEILSGAATQPELAESGGVNPPLQKAWRRALPWGAAGVLALATILVSVAYMQNLRARAPHVIALNMPVTDVASIPLMALSHDGRHFAYLAEKSDHWVLAIRSMETGAVQYYGAASPVALAWSPGDHYVFFGTFGKYSTLDVNSDITSDIDAPQQPIMGAAWMPNGRDLLAGGASRGILEINRSTRETQTLLKAGEGSVYVSPVLVDSGHFLFSVIKVGAVRIFHVMLSTLDGKSVRTLPVISYGPVGYASGYVFVTTNSDSLMAQALRTDGSLGEPVHIADHMAHQVPWLASFTVSEDGAIVYESGAGGTENLLLLDRSGKPKELPLGSGLFNNPRFSPDGKFIAYDRGDSNGNRDVWIYNLALRQATRFSLGGQNSDAVWSPDGRQIAYSTAINGSYEIVARPANGATGERVLVRESQWMFPRDWSPDGRFLVYDQYVSLISSVWKVAVAAGTPSECISADGFSKSAERISPNGKWIVYESTESGGAQIYLESFPKRTGKWQVSTDGGMQPRWSGDGQRVYFLSPDNKMMAADVVFAASGPQVTRISELFSVPPSLIAGGNPLDVTRDGSHIVLNAHHGNAGNSLNVLLNWPALLKNR